MWIPFLYVIPIYPRVYFSSCRHPICSFFFFAGLSIPISQAILAHLFSYNIQWSATIKEVQLSSFFVEIPKIARRCVSKFSRCQSTFKMALLIYRFWLPFLLSTAIIAGMIILATPLVPLDWRVGSSGWAVIFPLAWAFFSTDFAANFDKFSSVSLLAVICCSQWVPTRIYGVMFLTILGRLCWIRGSWCSHTDTGHLGLLTTYVLSLPSFIDSPQDWCTLSPLSSLAELVLDTQYVHSFHILYALTFTYFTHLHDTYIQLMLDNAGLLCRDNWTCQNFRVVIIK